MVSPLPDDIYDQIRTVKENLERIKNMNITEYEYTYGREEKPIDNGDERVWVPRFKMFGIYIILWPSMAFFLGTLTIIYISSHDNGKFSYLLANDKWAAIYLFYLVIFGLVFAHKVSGMSAKDAKTWKELFFLRLIELRRDEERRRAHLENLMVTHQAQAEAEEAARQREVAERLAEKKRQRLARIAALEGALATFWRHYNMRCDFDGSIGETALLPSFRAYLVQSDLFKLPDAGLLRETQHAPTRALLGDAFYKLPQPPK